MVLFTAAFLIFTVVHNEMNFFQPILFPFLPLRHRPQCISISIFKKEEKRNLQSVENNADFSFSLLQKAPLGS